MADVIDFTARLKLKAQSQCEHKSVEVSDTEADLSCVNCGAQLDPWWYIRREAHDPEGFAAHYNEQSAKFTAWQAEANAVIERQQRTIERLNTEIAELTAAKNRLWNEQVNGKPLGVQVDRRRDRRRA